MPSQKVVLPATVEQYFWTRNENTYGVGGNYTGVSWFSTKVVIPEEFRNKRIVISFERARLRAEVYINRKMAGYNLVNGIPFEFDISKFLFPGKENSIDIRITDPNVNFNWKDSQVFKWGEYSIVPSHGFEGIAGSVK